MNIYRYYNDLSNWLKPSKVLLIYGPRQVGKTTLINMYLEKTSYKYRFDNGEDLRIRELFESLDHKKILDYAGGYELIAIDEAQQIPNIGKALKILTDRLSGLRIIATGSSSFELAGQTGEPLTGRKRSLILFPVSIMELHHDVNPFDLKNRLDEFLIYGLYPEVIKAGTSAEKRSILNELVGSYLLKDILSFERVKSSKYLIGLLRLLAFQVGQEVSLSELGQQLSVDHKTVARYLDLLEKAFVIYNLRAFSRNIRKTISKKSKYYFFDNGIRNALIANFNDLHLRNDTGALWENFIFMERLKKRRYQDIEGNAYFWRSWSGQEIDLIEERGGKLYAFEFKRAEQKKTVPGEWKTVYPDTDFSVVHSGNYFDFII